MNLIKKMLTILFFSYIGYVFLFAFVIFSFHPSAQPLKKEELDFKTAQNYATKDRVALIETPADAISVRLNLIEQAETRIDLAYYRWSDGEVSDLMLGELLAAADRGVEIRILLDGILQLTNLGQPIENIFKGLALHPQVRIQVYEPFHPLFPIGWNNRMHDKMMIVDEQFAIIGGRNIQDRFYLEHADPAGIVSDREVLVHQADNQASNHSVLIEIENYYHQLWNYQHTKEKYQKLTKRQQEKGWAALNDLRTHHEQNKKDFLAKYFPNAMEKDWKQATHPAQSVQFVSNDLSRINQTPKVLHTLLLLAENAKESTFIQSPYFIPSRPMLKEYERYAIQPKQTTLFTNSEAVSPNLLAIASYHNRRQTLVDSGARIVEYQGPGSTHAKSAIFDEQISVVGTFNIDPRSTYINTEAMVIIDSEEFADDLKDAIAIDFQNSLEVAADYHYIETDVVEAAHLSFFKKITIRLISVFNPLFEHLL